MVEAGAAAMILESNLTAEKLYSLVESLLGDNQKLRDMEVRSKKLGKPDAAARIVDACMQLVSKNKRQSQNEEES